MKLSLALLTIATAAVTPTAAIEYCDNGVVGSGICRNTQHCCSKWGWCGTTSTHCDPATCHSGPGCPNGGTNPPPTPAPTISIPATDAPEPTTAPTTTPTPQPTPSPTTPPTPRPTLHPSTAPTTSTPATDAPETTPAPTSAPTTAPTPQPTPTPTNPPTQTPTPNPTSKSGGEQLPSCGNGVVGNGICDNPCECCSGWGWCSNLAAHCAADSCISSPDNSCTRPEAVFHDQCGSLPTPSTPAPTTAQTQPPVPPLTNPPTAAPVPIHPTTPVTPAPIAPAPPTDGAAAAVEAVLENSQHGIDNELFMYKTPTEQWEPSTVYRYQGFIRGLRVMYQQGVNGKHFYMGDDSSNGHEYGLINIANFLAQSMKETIEYDACDENSWDMVNGVYPLSNACGQLGQSYEDYHCSEEEAFMECPVDPTMSTTATTSAQWWGAPAPLKCGPKEQYPFTGFWDHYTDSENNQSPAANANGRTDVEGCCWWGRGVIQTTGVCNFGKLNFFLGKRAHDEGRESPYPTIDFCQDPGAICASQEFTELKWIAGLFYWVETVQPYDSQGWNYMDELHKYVDGGMQDDGFVNAVSGIVNRGCHNPPCASGSLHGGPERLNNFNKVLSVFDLKQRRNLRTEAST